LSGKGYLWICHRSIKLKLVGKEEEQCGIRSSAWYKYVRRAIKGIQVEFESFISSLHDPAVKGCLSTEKPLTPPVKREHCPLTQSASGNAVQSV